MLSVENLAYHYKGRPKLAFHDCAHGASASTSAAAHTSVFVDDVSAVAFGDSANGASACAGTTSDTAVRNNICHLSILLI